MHSPVAVRAVLERAGGGGELIAEFPQMHLCCSRHRDRGQLAVVGVAVTNRLGEDLERENRV